MNFYDFTKNAASQVLEFIGFPRISVVLSIVTGVLVNPWNYQGHSRFSRIVNRMFTGIPLGFCQETGVLRGPRRS